MSKITIFLHLHENATNLTKTLDSISNQTCKDFDLIIIDDNSCNKIKNILAEYNWGSFKNIKICFLNENYGDSYAFNYAVKKATTEYIFSCSCGYILNNNFIKIINKHINSKNDADVFSFSKGDRHVNSDWNLLNASSDDCYASQDIVSDYKLKVFKREFLVKNNISMCDFRHYTLIFLIDIMRANPIWYFINESLLTYESQIELTYNIFDLYEQCKMIITQPYIKDLKDSRQELIIFLITYTLIKRFLGLALSIHKNNLPLLNTAFNDVNDFFNVYIPNWKDNKYILKYMFKSEKDLASFIIRKKDVGHLLNLHSRSLKKINFRS